MEYSVTILIIMLYYALAIFTWNAIQKDIKNINNNTKDIKEMTKDVKEMQNTLEQQRI